jgi:hypothetical protein
MSEKKVVLQREILQLTRKALELHQAAATLERRKESLADQLERDSFGAIKLKEALLALEKPYRFSKKQLINFVLAYEKYTDNEHFEEGVNEMVAHAFLEDIGFTKNGKEIGKVLGGKT